MKIAETMYKDEIAMNLVSMAVTSSEQKCSNPVASFTFYDTIQTCNDPDKENCKKYYGNRKKTCL